MHARQPLIIRGESHQWHPALVLFALLLSAFASSQPVDAPLTVEVFTSSEQVPVVAADIQSDDVRVEIYRLDGLHQLETTLSAQLPNDPAAAQRVAQQRIGQLDRDDRDTLRSAAVGLAKAQQYGLNRYPAIVIDGAVVVYGTTDVEVALSRYRLWQAQEAR